jgi:hypothetical protein
MNSSTEESPRLSVELFSMGNLYLAYRKAKTEAFYENTHFHALSFTKFEQDLHRNLLRLRKRLTARVPDWTNDRAFVGDHAYLPKSVDATPWESQAEGHFRALDPKSDWLQRYHDAGCKAEASLRLIIRPTVDFQIVSALWVLRVGHLFDGALDARASFGNRLRRSRWASADPRSAASGVNLTTPGLFAPYFSAYREWREGGLRAMEQSVGDGRSILAITMDIEKFYHRVSPKFLLRHDFLKTIGVELTSEEVSFTACLLQAMAAWYKQTPDAKARAEGAIPVGLSASKIIANVLLVQFDRAVLEKLRPIHYGRYVDDIFLVMPALAGENGFKRVTHRIAEALTPLMRVRNNESGPAALTLHLPYAEDSELVFAGGKQKIFALSSAHGADLVHHIRDQIRQQSSEYRLLPSVPETGVAMASRALLATPNAALQADALRKADVLSVRRLGFSHLLSDIETYASDLRPLTWRKTRREFYELVHRHVVTPEGFFDYFGYIPRVFGLMVACGDFDDAARVVTQLAEVADLLVESTTLGEEQHRQAFSLCMEQYARALLDAAVRAATVEKSAEPKAGLTKLLRELRRLHPEVGLPRTARSTQYLAKQVLLADWGRRPYKEYWFQEQGSDEMGPKVPREMEVKRQLRLGAIRRFRKSAANLKVPHWPALAFPTRPLRIDEIGLVAPGVLSDPRLFRNAIKLLRGAEVASHTALGFDGEGGDQLVRFSAAGRPRDTIRIAVTSVKTTEDQWKLAARGRQDRSAARYEAFNRLLNRILKEPKRPDYIVMPELCMPLRWALRAARKLAANGVSLMTGVEYHADRVTRKLRNDCLVSLTTFWPGYASSVVVLQPKFAPAHAERANLTKLLGKSKQFFVPTGVQANPTVYIHREFFFAPLICSDLTNLTHRSVLRGNVDALFIVEWNQDTKTFASLVEASASDLHAFVVQANNRAYGDSRIRAPAVQDYERDVVQVKGGVADYYVLGEINVAQLRQEQRRRTCGPKFKPLPIGYVGSAARKAGK